MGTEDRLKKIIEELAENRKGAYDLLEKIKQDRSNLDSIQIDSSDFRKRGHNMSLAAELAKTKNEATSSELNLRKTIDSNIKLEYELTTKLEDRLAGKDNDNELNVDIRALVKEIKKIETDNVEQFPKTLNKKG